MARHSLPVPAAGFNIWAVVFGACSFIGARWAGGLALGVFAMLGLNTAHAAAITWATPVTIAGDTDVSTNGTLVSAMNVNAAATTINGVTFAAGTGTVTGNGTTGGTITLGSFTLFASGGDHNLSSYTGFGTSSTPYNNLSSAYKAMLTAAFYVGTPTYTITMSGLTSGHTYTVQIWGEDARANATYSSTVTSTGGNSVTLTYGTSAAGGLGKYIIGTFVADATTQVFTISGSSVINVLNGIQLRDQGVVVPTTVYWNGNLSGTWDVASTANWVSNSVSGKNYVDGVQTYFDDTASGATTVSNTVAVSPGSLFVNTTNLAYTLGGSGISGSPVLTKNGTNTLTLNGANTLGSITLNAGTVTLNGTNTIGTPTVASGAALTIGGAGQLGGGTYSGGIINNGTFTFDSSAAQTISGTAISGTGPVTIASGHTLVLGTTISGSTNVTIASGATLTISHTGNNALPSASADVWNVAGTISITGSGEVDTIAPTLNLNGGTLTSTTSGGADPGLGSFHVGAAGATIIANGTGNLISAVDFSIGGGQTLVLNTPLAGDTLLAATKLKTGNATAGLSKSGLGTVTLTGANTYNGSTTVNGGTLIVNGSLGASSAVTVNSGATLGGVGTVNGPVTLNSGATLTAGTNSVVGTLNLASSLTLNATSTNFMRISKTGGTAASDVVQGWTGTLTYAGTLVVTDITSDTNTLANGDTFTLFPAGTRSGGFGTVTLPALTGGLTWDTTQLASGGYITVTNVAATPVFSPAGGGYVGALLVTITSESGSTILYTTDGTDPTVSGTVVSNASPATVTVPVNTLNMVITAYATKPGETASVNASATYSTVTSLPPDDVQAFQVADQFLAQMTIAEKATLCTKGSTMEQVDGIPRLGIPNFRYVGASCAIYPEVTTNDYFTFLYPWTDLIDAATCLPTGTALAATWDVNEAAAFGDVLGAEGRDRGFDFLLGGPVNILRTPLDGRNFEFMGEDPCLVAKLIAPMMSGIQSNNVAATVKHFACNNQENGRTTMNVLVDERTLREIYLPSFEAAVHEGGAYTVMNAYNKLRGLYCSENTYLLTEILKNEWGFLGFVHSDWGSVHDTVAPALAGLDMEVNAVAQSSLNWGNGNLAAAVTAGQVPESVLNDKARRILYVMAKINLIGGGTRMAGSRNTPAHQATAFNIAADSIVLLKNDAGVLPLAPAALGKVLVVGSLANTMHCSTGGSSSGKPPYEVTPLQGIQTRLSNQVNQVTIDYVDMSGPFTNVAQYDAVLVFVGHSHTEETEGTDLTNIQMPSGQDAAVAQLLLANPKTIVINHSGTPLEMPWITNAPTVLQTWFDGQEAGNALAAVLCGDVNPSGKLPFTMPVKLADTAVTALNLYSSTVANYAEGMLVGYRWFDAMNIQPMFPFGHGLSYTTFGYGTIAGSNTMAPGGNLTVSVSVTNTGPRVGAEVVQLYLHALNPALPSPPQALKAFQKLLLNPGETQTAVFTLTPRDFSYWDVNLNCWHEDAGNWEIRAATSSRDIRATANVQVQPYPTIVNDGIINPGGWGTNGVLVADSFNQTTNGTLVMEISGPGTNDSVTGMQTVTLAGTLVLTNLNGFAELAGQSFTLIQATSIVGAFDHLVLPPLPVGLSWAIGKSGTTTLIAEVVSSRIWDSSPATPGVQDGPGTWDVTNTNWWNGAANVAWNTNPPDSAAFGTGSGAAGTIALAAPITVENLTFNAPGSGHYTIANGTLTLAGSSLLTVNDDTTISSAITGDAVTKAGAGTLTLYGPSVFASSMLLDAGTIKIVQGTNCQSPNFEVSSGAALEFNTTGQAAITGIPGTANTIANLQTLTLAGSGCVRITGTGYTVAGRGGAFTCNLSTGAWFDVQSSDIQFGWQQGAFTANLGSLNVASGAGFHCNDSAFQFDALTGAGTVGNAFNSAVTLTAGVSGTQNNPSYGVSNNTATFAGALKDQESYNGVTTANLNFTKSGGGTQILTGTNTYQGATTVSGGTLMVNSPGSLAAASAVTLLSYGTLGGSGTVAGSVTVNGTIAPGSGAVGTLNTGAETWNGGGRYVCELNSTNAIGCDRLNITGALNVQATTGGKFTLKLVSLTPGNAAGPLTNFYKYASYTWTVATASGGLANFAANKFLLDMSSFSNNFSGGAFSLAVAGNNLVVNYTAAPAVRPVFSGLASLGAGGMQLGGTGGVGEAYVLLGVTNLAPAVWIPLATNWADLNGVFQFTDPQATNHGQQFYRLSVP